MHWANVTNRRPARAFLRNGIAGGTKIQQCRIQTTVPFPLWAFGTEIHYFYSEEFDPGSG